MSIAKQSTQKVFKLPHAAALIKYTLSFIELSQNGAGGCSFCEKPNIKNLIENLSAGVRWVPDRRGYEEVS